MTQAFCKTTINISDDAISQAGDQVEYALVGKYATAIVLANQQRICMIVKVQ
jgi:hypothetical protein